MRQLLFSHNGRLNRGAFWTAHFILFGLLIASWVACALLALLVPTNTDTWARLALMIVLFAAIIGLFVGSLVGAIWSGVCLGIKRYHDHDKPGVWVCIQFVPVIGGMWYFIEAFCLDGTHGPNAFGTDPLGRAPYVPYVPPPASWPGPDRTPGQFPQVPYAPRPPSGRPGWVLPVMFALLIPPLLALAAGLIVTARSAMWLASAVHVDGTVTSLKPGGTNDKGHTQYYPIVEGTTTEGKVVHVTGDWSTYPPAEIGSKMEIAYPPGRPDAAQLVEFVSFWLLPVILDSFAVIVVGWLLVILIVKLAWKRAPRAIPRSAPATSG